MNTAQQNNHICRFTFVKTCKYKSSCHVLLVLLAKARIRHKNTFEKLT